MSNKEIEGRVALAWMRLDNGCVEVERLAGEAMQEVAKILRERIEAHPYYGHEDMAGLDEALRIIDETLLP